MTNPYEAPETAGSTSEERLSTRPSRRWLVAASFSLLPFLWIAVSVDRGNPTWWKPFSLIAVIFTMFLGSKVVAFLCSALIVLPAFALFSGSLLREKPRISYWSVVFVVLHGLNAIYLMALFSSGVRHQGREHTVTICSITLGLFVGFLVLGMISLKRPSFSTALACHWLAWFWLILYSFPLLEPLFTLI